MKNFLSIKLFSINKTREEKIKYEVKFNSNFILEFNNSETGKNSLKFLPDGTVDILELTNQEALNLACLGADVEIFSHL